MKRTLITSLLAWKDKTIHLPLLLCGARQVGKTYLIESFGKANFANVVSINFEVSPEYIACFETLKPDEILPKIEIINQQKIVPGETLLFLDEIQACPNAIIALRYFREMLPALHVMGAGSLLEFALQEKGMHMPVGRVQYLYLKPLSFQEYLQVSGNDNLLAFLETANLSEGVPSVIHEQALKLVREYMIIGGMPMVVSEYMQNHTLRTCQEYQTLLLRTYSDDFAKYSASAHHKYLQRVYNQTPGLVGQQVKYSNIAEDMPSRYLKSAISDLNKADVLSTIYATAVSGLPLMTHINEKKFKLLFLDVGLLKRATKLDMELLFNEDLLLLNRGALAEQFVGQELLAYQDAYDVPELFYWARDKKNSQAEVDYITNVDANIVPIEVKSGKTGTLKSLQLLMQEKKLPLGLRVSEKPLEFRDNILSVPFYLLFELPRLVNALL